MIRKCNLRVQLIMQHNHKNHFGSPAHRSVFDFPPKWKNGKPNQSPKSEKPLYFCQKAEKQDAKQRKNWKPQQTTKPKNQPKKWPIPVSHSKHCISVPSEYNIINFKQQNKTIVHIILYCISSFTRLQVDGGIAAISRRDKASLCVPEDAVFVMHFCHKCMNFFFFLQNTLTKGR